MRRDYDVMVVGAGPAGSTAARVAAERGLSVLLIDRAKFPRHKPCAGGVTAKSLRELGFDLPESIVEHEIRGIKLVSSCGRSVVGQGSKRLGVTVRRSAFDSFLVTKAVETGVCFVDGVHLVGLESPIPGPRERYVVATNLGGFRARTVIGADGVTGNTARLAGIRRRWSRWELGASLSAEVEFPEASAISREPELIELYLVPPLRAAFGWAFHRKNGLHVGIGATAIDAARLWQAYGTHFGRVMEAMRLNLPSPRPKGHMLPMGGIRRRIAREGVFLVGDAAGFVDPFSGEGIYHAIRSGRIAAEVLAESITSGSLSKAAPEYTRRCYQEFMEEFRLSILLAALLGKKDGIPFAVAQANPSLVFLLADVLYEAGSYRRLFTCCMSKSPVLAARLVMAKLGLLRIDGGQASR
ncbi:MAG: NAD(P)/FAD-dependent oxidoreductase [Bacillota bacterium]